MTAGAQVLNDEYNQMNPDGTISTRDQRRQKADSLGTDKEIPKGIRVWTIDRRFGDIRQALPDTLSPMFMNSIFTTGLRGEYNTTGNLGAPRQNRIFIDRRREGEFIFTQPYDFFLTPIEDFHFTNTLSPFTNLSFNTCGDRLTGEDHFTAKFGVNAGKRLGLGFKFDYIYGRGYYASQSTSHFNYTMYGSYLGDRYQAHFRLTTNHQKVAENGGITSDDYVTHPELFSESFATSDIPTVLDRNWNRNESQQVFLSQRYSLGFNRKVKMTAEEIEARKFAMAAKKDQQKRDAKEKARLEAEERGEDFDEAEYERKLQREGAVPLSGRPDDAQAPGTQPLGTQSQPAPADTTWMKNEYVPVTSFIHTLDFNLYKRIYQAYDTPADFYANTYDVAEALGGDSIYDKTRHYSLRNTLAVSLLEGFNKWAKAGVKAFATHEMRHFTLPDAGGTRSWNEQNVFVGGQISKESGRTLHYSATAQFGVAGEEAGAVEVDASMDMNFRLFGDTVSLRADGFFHRTKPVFYYEHYQSRHYFWDNENLDDITHSRIAGTLSWAKTRTRVRVAFDQISNYTYMGLKYAVGEDGQRTGNEVNVRQSGGSISLFTVQLMQDFRLGPLCWDNVVTYQKSSDDALPVPELNVYTNLYLRFKIARVLRCDLGADLRYFTKYYAPDYAPGLGQYAVQEGEGRVQTGGYPIANVYANFHLKHTRFFIMMSHINAGKGNREYFLTPHYPINESVLRFGLSWNFFN